MGSLPTNRPAKDAVSVSRKNHEILLNQIKVTCVLLAQP